MNLLRELRCEHRTFRTVKGALVWFARYRADDRDDNGVRVPASKEARERTQNTYSFLLLALCPTAPDVDQFNLLHIEKLIDWHCAWVPQKELAKDWGFPNMYTLRQTMRFTEGVLRNRLEVRGLLREGERMAA
jgi:hypothetical protein